MSLSSTDSFDCDIESLTVDCEFGEVTLDNKKNQNVMLHAIGNNDEEDDIFQMADINFSDTVQENGQHTNGWNSGIDKSAQVTKQAVSGKIKEHVNDDSNSKIKDNTNNSNWRSHLDSGIESMNSVEADDDSLDSGDKQNSYTNNQKLEDSNLSQEHSTNKEHAGETRHLSWLEENGESVEVLPLPQLSNKWVPQFRKTNSIDEVRSLISFWSDKTCLHAPLKRTTSEPGTLKMQWLEAMEKAKTYEDPWKNYQIIETCPTERAKRYRYNALKKKWVVDLVYVKMQEESFGHGAMRKCYRMKKLSTRVHQDDWAYARNVVAKHYIEDVMPKAYFDDIKLQMDAKLWAEEYNRHNPPKKIDIIQVACISMIDREGSPMYHVEHFVEGEYKKYNSNSGFVLREEEHVRATPQAFSHFTFERSGHQMIVVDIQGVGDLYTDPQIHTAKADEYGEANLGSKGMALFFATHECTGICKELNLEMFDISPSELLRIHDTGPKSSATTEIRHHVHGGNTPESSAKMMPMFDLVGRIRSISSDECSLDYSSDYISSENLSTPAVNALYPSEFDSGVSSDADSVRAQFFNQIQHKSACVGDSQHAQLSTECIEQRLNDLKNYEEMQVSILGNIHYDLAVYNYIGRFTDGEPDYDSTLFHLNKATLCGSLEANQLMALKYFNLPTDQFAELKVMEDHDRGMDCLIEAATRGDRESIIKTAKAFDTGVNLGRARQKSWLEAMKWYEAAINVYYAGEGTYPVHEIYARMAEMWREGGNGIEKDPSYAGELFNNAADAAMAVGKGKIANKYFMYAEEVWGEVEG